MRKRFWRSDNQQESWRLSSFRLQAATCFVSILTLTVILRISTIVWAVPATCVEADQFWFQRYQSDWPLGGAFFLVFFLLLVWNLAIVANQIIRGVREWLLPTVNFVSILLIMTISSTALQTAEVSHHKRERPFGEWSVDRPNWWEYRENRCVVARDYAGGWKVIYKDLSDPNMFPAIWIELRPSLTYAAIDYPSQRPYDGRWSPPTRRFDEPVSDTDGGFEFENSVSYWDFEIEGDQLILTTSEWAPQRDGDSEVVLERDQAE